MSVTGSHYHVEMADASTSTAEDREENMNRGLSESPVLHFNNSAFTFPKPIYGGYCSYSEGDDSINKNEESEDPYNDLRDEVSYSLKSSRGWMDYSVVLISTVLSLILIISISIVQTAC